MICCLKCENTGRFTNPYAGPIGDFCGCDHGALRKIANAWIKAKNTESPDSSIYGQYVEFINTCAVIFASGLMPIPRSQEPLQGEKTEQEHGG